MSVTGRVCGLLILTVLLASCGASDLGTSYQMDLTAMKVPVTLNTTSSPAASEPLTVSIGAGTKAVQWTTQHTEAGPTADTVTQVTTTHSVSSSRQVFTPLEFQITSKMPAGTERLNLRKAEFITERFMYLFYSGSSMDLNVEFDPVKGAGQ